MVTTIHYSPADKVELLKLLKQFSEVEGLNKNPFLSYSWQHSWVSSLPALPKLIAFQNEGKPVGYAFYNTRKLLPVLPLKHCFLNQMGNSECDQVWIEFNDIICIERFKGECIKLFISEMLKQSSIAKFSISMCSAPEAWTQAAQNKNYTIQMDKTPGYRTSLENIGCVEDVLRGMSRNSRNKVNRAIRDAESIFGMLSIKKYEKAEAEKFLNRLGIFHKKQWMDTPLGSGFTNKYFVEHHKTLCCDFFDSVDMLEVKAGDTSLGLSYNLIHNNRVYFYCSGINDNTKRDKLKPGYIMHTLLMSYYGNLGFGSYDFMAGDSQYKRSLSSEKYNLYTLDIYKNSVAIKLGRRFFRFIKKLFSTPSQDSPQQ